jgi:hypothetical protein
VLSQIALSVCRLELEQRGDTERVDLAIIGLIARVFEAELGAGDLAKRDAGAIGRAAAIFRHRAEAASVCFDGAVGIANAAEEVTEQRDRQPADCEYAIRAVEADAGFLAEHVGIAVPDADGEFAFDTEECVGLEACAARDRAQTDILAIVTSAVKMVAPAPAQPCAEAAGPRSVARRAYRPPRQRQAGMA